MGKICHLRGNKLFCQFRGRKYNMLVGGRKFSVRMQEHLRNKGNLKNKREIEQERGTSESIRGHPFMTSTKKSGFPSLCLHASTWAGPPPPCGGPHAADMKYTLFS